jgi:transposase-like protein
MVKNIGNNSKNYTKFRDKEWLKKQYLELGKTQEEIANECNVVRGTIRYWLNKNNIKRRYKDKNWLRYQHKEKRKKVSEIAKECNTTPPTIYRWLERFNISLNEIKTYEHGNFNGDIVYHAGHRLFYHPKHPRADKSGRVREYILIMEEKIGRHLKEDEIVHHIDGNQLNNNINNLYLCKNKSEHSKLHQELHRIALKLVQQNKIKFHKGHYFLP